MRTANIDAIVAPGYSIPAFTLGASRDLTASTSYTALYNLLNFPAGNVPITIVQKSDLQNPRKTKKDMWETKANLMDKDSEGLPVGGLPYIYLFYLLE